MSRLYLAPIASDWIDEFERTLESPISLPDTELIILLESELSRRRRNRSNV